jgi:hypothetical protein
MNSTKFAAARKDNEEEDEIFTKIVMNEDTDVEELHPGRPKRTPTLPKWLQDFNMPHKLK